MGEKSNDTEGGEKKTSNDQNSKKNESIATAVLKMDLHCIGCISKLKKLLASSYKGVEYVKADLDSNKLTLLIGKVDPVEVQKFLEHKTKKKVDLISPTPKKDDLISPTLKKDNTKDTAAVVHDAEKKLVEEKTEKKQDDNKSKEPQETTAVMKMSLHCEGCIEKVYKYVTKTKGYQEIKIDREKEAVTVKGTMDMKALVELLKEKLKTPVDIVQPKKEKDGNTEGKNGDGGREGITTTMTTTTRTEENKLQYYPPMGYYGYPAVGSPPAAAVGGGGGGGQSVWGDPNPPGFEFSDDNPNACSVM